VFAGREVGTYSGAGGPSTPLEIRTSRFFAYYGGRWVQLHHHGSIDDPDALRAPTKEPSRPDDHPRPVRRGG